MYVCLKHGVFAVVRTCCLEWHFDNVMAGSSVVYQGSVGNTDNVARAVVLGSVEASLFILYPGQSLGHTCMIREGQ